MAEQDGVGTRSLAYLKMERNWSLIDALMAGTQAMRDDRDLWIPRNPREQEPDYAWRLKRTYLYGALKDTIRKLVSKPFSKAVSIRGQVPQPLQPMVDDIDQRGTDISKFARDWLTSALRYGVCHVLVDYPAVTVDNPAEQSGAVRPYAVLIHAPEMIGWRSSKDAFGREVLTEVRFCEDQIEPDGPWGEKKVRYIRVYRAPLEDGGPGAWERHRYNETTSSWALIESGTHSYPGIPLVTLYTEQTGLLSGDPPLLDLAWLNLEHLQSSSEQSAILAYCRTPILYERGVDPESKDKPITVGAGGMHRSSNPQGDMKYVEHSGAAIGEGWKHLDRTEERMQILGLQPLLESGSGSKTATEIGAGEARTHSQIQDWIRSLESGIRAIFEAASTWLSRRGSRIELPQDLAFDVWSEFGIGVRASEDIRNLIAMRSAGDIDRVTLLAEVKRRGLLAENLEPKDVIERLEEEGERLAEMGMGEEEPGNGEPARGAPGPMPMLEPMR